jgi:hypothetical protein
VEVPNNMDALERLRKHLEDEDADLLREMVRVFAERLMRPRWIPSAERASAR